jgi:hypothetical protein
LSTKGFLGIRVLRWLAIAGVIVLIAFLQPYIFGFSGRISEVRFQRGLHRGMTRKEVVRLAARFGGTGLQDEDPAVLLMDDYAGARGVEDVKFVDFTWWCGSGGKWYALHFTPDWRLTLWEINSWESAC